MLRVQLLHACVTTCASLHAMLRWHAALRNLLRCTACACRFNPALFTAGMERLLLLAWEAYEVSAPPLPPARA